MHGRVYILRLNEQFACVFDLGDNWQYQCTVGRKLADPMEGSAPSRAGRCHAGARRDPRSVRPPLEWRRRQQSDAVRAVDLRDPERMVTGLIGRELLRERLAADTFGTPEPARRNPRQGCRPQRPGMHE